MKVAEKLNHLRGALIERVYYEQVHPEFGDEFVSVTIELTDGRSVTFNGTDAPCIFYVEVLET
jgi:hypothetical protein